VNFQDEVWKEALHDRINDPPTREVQDEFVGLNPKDIIDVCDACGQEILREDEASFSHFGSETRSVHGRCLQED
jgi:hypothetical protein